MRASALKVPDSFTKVLPKGDLVLAKVAEAEEKTTGGILLPGSAQKRPTSGDVVAVGDGALGGGRQHSFELGPGDTILYSKFGLGVTELEVGGEAHILLREDDVIGVLPRSAASAADIPELRPAGDRVLVQVQESADVTLGGVILPDSAKERPLSGAVVRAGPGKAGEDGKRTAPRLAHGDKVIYFKYAGDAMETPDGTKYVVLREQDILAKL